MDVIKKHRGETEFEAEENKISAVKHDVELEAGNKQTHSTIPPLDVKPPSRQEKKEA